jgi:hypothetical protein
MRLDELRVSGATAPRETHVTVHAIARRRRNHECAYIASIWSAYFR